MEKLISIVIPAKNEEKMIARCIEGAINALKNIESWEIILVDSYSTDNTVEIAKQYPIKILRLKKEWFKSPHAGRYIGTINSSGKYIFFLDADMIVEEGWIETALDVLEKDEKLAGITGVMYNVLPNDSLSDKHRMKGIIGNVQFLPGASIYKKKVLLKVNHFNPFLKGNGEREIGHRIEKAGYNQLRVDKTICYHLKKEYNLNESLEKASYFIGVGQFLKLHYNNKILFENIIRYKTVFLYFTLILSMFILTVIAIILANLKIILYPFIIVLFFLSGIMIWKKPKKTFLVMNGLTMASFNLFFGVFKKTKKWSDYPVNVEIVQ